MLSEERLARITALVTERQSITIQELMKILGTSESTTRRDLTILDAEGKITKVFGGALAKGVVFRARDDTVMARKHHNKEEKAKIARYAAMLIKANDFVYLDAGTTTELMIDFITEKTAVFVTNGFLLAKKLSEKGFLTYIPGGEVKFPTEAIVGIEAAQSLRKYNFSIGFWGTNGINKENGFSTPDVKEALVKQTAMEKTRQKYVICDASKFSQISCVTFAAFDSATIVTSGLEDEHYKNCKNILEV
ncbi:MAG: DeoR/GlpR family DNA-binding transcription regulator [Treponema sp.]|jgi:DeoR family fructose operon transcriptional repressor|nr:DeoR/GlpR family DNA-binding transcription regulator [Treponema sp.]